MRDAITVIGGLLRGEEVWFEGETFTVAGAKLDFAPPRPAIPIYLGVTGPRALALAGEIADGVLLNGFVSVSYTARAVEIVRAAARDAGRDPDTIEIAQSIVVSVAGDSQRARDAARPLVATYLAEFPNVAREAGLPSEDVSRIAAAHREGGIVSSAPLVSDGIVTRLTCAGTVDDVRSALCERRRAGVHLPVLSFVESTMISSLADVITAP